MTVHTVRAQDRDSLAKFLGWFSVALGTAQIAAPRTMCRLVGSSGKGSAPLVMRLMGVREIAQGAGILARPRPTTWLWSRVAGDGLDLSLLGVVAARNRKRRYRTAFAIANVVGVAIPDVMEAMHLTKKSGPPQSGKRIRKSITVRKPREQVEHAFTSDEELRRKVERQGATVSYSPAPGGRGTEIIVEWVDQPPLGELGAVAKKLTGSDLATQLADDLRLLKQRLETGDIVRSDAVPEGHRLGAHLKQRPAQPLEEAVR